VGRLVPSIGGVLMGDPGELLVRGAHVNRRYFNDPDATRATKIPSADGSVWHRTGDVGRFDRAGRLWLLGRIDDAISIRGEHVYPLAVEALAADVPGVEWSAFIAHDRAREGELLFVTSDDRAVARIGEALRARVPDGLPVRRVTSIPVDARHESKIDRAALRRARERGELRNA
jgi:acyl-CoA synthetase (AMP-forming)/AMP-acid ligase II